MNVDVDMLDSDFIRSLPVIPYDQTSNPIWLFVQLQNPSAKELATQILRSDNDLSEIKDELLFLSRLVRNSLQYYTSSLLMFTLWHDEGNCLL